MNKPEKCCGQTPRLQCKDEILAVYWCGNCGTLHTVHLITGNVRVLRPALIGTLSKEIQETMKK